MDDTANKIINWEIKPMRYNLLLLAFFISVPILGQEYNSSKIALGFFYSPNLSYRNLSQNDLVADFRDNTEVVKYGQSFGLVFLYRISHLLGLESGVNTQIRGFQTKLQDVIIAEPNPEIPDKIKTVDRFYYLGFPLKLTLYKNFKKISVIPAVGIIGNVLLHQDILFIGKTGEQTDVRKTVHTNDYRSFIITSIVGFGINWNISESIDLMITPTFQYDIVPVMDAPLNTNLWDLGINFGCLFNL